MKLATTCVICISLAVLVLAQNECPSGLKEKFLRSREECLNETRVEPTTTTTTTPTPTIDDGLIDDVENTETEELPEVLAQNVADDDDDDTTDTQQHSHACRRGRNGRRHRNGFGAPLPWFNQYKRCLVDKILNEPGVAEIQTECEQTIANVDEAYVRFHTDVCILRRVKTVCGITPSRRWNRRNRHGHGHRRHLHNRGQSTTPLTV